MERKFYSELLKWKKESINIPLMVLGARQIGKTYIINEFCKNEFDDYIYVNFLDRVDLVELFESNINSQDKINKFELIMERTIKEETILFFDEVQESEGFISMLKYLCEAEFNYKVICAGSLLGVKLKRYNSSFPVGKVIIKHMYPMTFDEFLIAMDNKKLVKEIENCFDNNVMMEEHLHLKLLDYYRMYLCIGGMPASILNFINSGKKVLEINMEILNSIISAYTSDMTKYVHNTSENVRIERIYNNIPSQLAKENKKFQYSKIDKNARKRDYESSIDWLIASSLVIPSYFVSTFESPLKGFMDSSLFKLYLGDVGILTRMLELSLSKIMLDEDMRYKGVIAENYVMTELVANGLSIYYWQKNQVAEIDVIIDTEEGVIPIEIKAGENNKSKSLNFVMENNNIKNTYRISTNNFGKTNGIKSVPLYAVFCIKQK